MANIIKSLFKRPKDSARGSNSEELELQMLEKKLQSWNPPKIAVHDVYGRRGIFESKPSYTTETLEKTVPIRGEFQEIPLFPKNVIRIHQRRYEYLHIGLVQVGVKPLNINGLNCSVLVAVRDCRMLRFDDSRLALAESSLCDGPVYFKCHPNYPMALRDCNNFDVFVINIRTSGFQTNQGSRDIDVVYRVHYKVMTSAFLNLKSKVKFSRGETTLVQTNLLRHNLAVPKTVEWNSVEIPEEWKVRDEAQRPTS